jgi:hypothetical protein
MYAKVPFRSLNFCGARPACWAAQLGQPVVLRGLIWDVGVAF